MKSITSAILLQAPVIFLLLGLARPVFAHGGEPRLEISSEVVRPGEMLEIRGVDFGPERQITLALGSGPGALPLGSVTADAEGIFLLTVGLPDDLPEGIYVIHAASEEHAVESPAFTVRGVAANQDGGQDVREEQDGLLAAMPTYAPTIRSTAVAASTVHTEPEWQETIMFLMIISLASVGLLLVYGLRAGRVR